MRESAARAAEARLRVAMPTLRVLMRVMSLTPLYLLMPPFYAMRAAMISSSFIFIYIADAIEAMQICCACSAARSSSDTTQAHR